MKLPQVLENILFLDIETVPEATDFGQLNKEVQNLYAAKTAYKRKADDLSAEDYYDHAGIWAEFGKSFVFQLAMLPQQLMVVNLEYVVFLVTKKNCLLNLKPYLIAIFQLPNISFVPTMEKNLIFLLWPGVC